MNTNPIKEVKKITGTKANLCYFNIIYTNGTTARINILNNSVIRYQLDPSGVYPEYPTPSKPEHIAKITAKSLEEYGLKTFNLAKLTKDKETNEWVITVSENLKIKLSARLGIIKIVKNNKTILQEVAPIFISQNKSVQTLVQKRNENFFGGGTQNGRFTHKNRLIRIENTNSWVDGGVASPNPFYYSTAGYGILRNTFAKGIYDFGSENNSVATNMHNENVFDAFYFFQNTITGILQDYYELTGNPILLPEYAFYQSHLNAYNRDYWVEVDSSNPSEMEKVTAKFENGKYYKEYQPNALPSDKAGILESLQGEGTKDSSGKMQDNYLFSAQKVIDRYIEKDMPLGWFLPNDGYGAGYGQTSSLDGNLENLKAFSKYANSKGVELGLWTQQNLHPVDKNKPQPNDRDINKEVSKCKMRGLKTDVAWVGAGYSFGLNGIEDAAKVIHKETKGAVRPNIVSLDGWAGTQRHSGIWSGDQTGGKWEYIRFHIPTYIGTSLSGQPNIGSDMDGIFGGKDQEVNIRDFQWKAFTPTQFNMDGWGANPKTPFSFDVDNEKNNITTYGIPKNKESVATKINRAYLKLKSSMLPYIYSIAHKAVNGLPMIRAMALEFPNDKASYIKDTQYQYMWGANLLIAPIYNGKKAKNSNNSLRDEIRLPNKNQIWTDLFSGEKYQGGNTINNFEVPLWKIPVFIKDGSIIPLINPNNNPSQIDRKVRSFLIYPNGKTTFELYQDDGISSDYKKDSNNFATTLVTSKGPKSNSSKPATLFLNIEPTKGNYKGIVINQTTYFYIPATSEPSSIQVGSQNLQKITSLKEFNTNTASAYYYGNDYKITGEYLEDAPAQKFIRIKVQKQSVKTPISIKIKDYINYTGVVYGKTELDLGIKIPNNFIIDKNSSSATSLKVQWDKVQWDKVQNATSYDVKKDGIININIKDLNAEFGNFEYLSKHKFQVRTVIGNKVSSWSNEIIGKTLENPYEHAVKNMEVSIKTHDNVPVPNYGGNALEYLTDLDLTTMYHSNLNKPYRAFPEQNKHMTLTFDFKKVYKIETATYVPRDTGNNGNITKMRYRTSLDKVNWSSWSNNISWEANSDQKNINLENQKIRFFQMQPLHAMGGNSKDGYYISGNQVIFMNQKDFSSYILGDITNDGILDNNDIESLKNYAGLQEGDADFGGYVQNGDSNLNGIIDAYDISYVYKAIAKQNTKTTQETSTKASNKKSAIVLAASGNLILETNKSKVKKGEKLTITLKGSNLNSVDSFSAVLPFDSTKFLNNPVPIVQNTATTKNMENFSKYRKHTNGTENIHFIFVNNKSDIQLKGNQTLALLTLTAAKDLSEKEIQSVLGISNKLLVNKDLLQTNIL